MKVTETAEYTEYDTGTAIVRIHSGTRTEAEREAVMREAAMRYLKAICAAQPICNNVGQERM